MEPDFYTVWKNLGRGPVIHIEHVTEAEADQYVISLRAFGAIAWKVNDAESDLLVKKFADGP